MSLLYALFLRQPQTLPEDKQQAQLDFDRSQTEPERHFYSHHRQIEANEKFRQVRENYYLERRSIW